jgi:hypothetical protein
MDFMVLSWPLLGKEGMRTTKGMVSSGEGITGMKKRERGRAWRIEEIQVFLAFYQGSRIKQLFLE